MSCIAGTWGLFGCGEDEAKPRPELGAAQDTKPSTRVFESADPRGLQLPQLVAVPTIHYPVVPAEPTSFDGVVDQTRTVSDDALLRFAVDYESGVTRVEVTTPELAARPEPLGQIMLDPSAWTTGRVCWGRNGCWT